MKKRYLFLSLTLFSIITFSQTVLLEQFGPNFNTPVEVAHANDSRLFIVEKSGIIKILNADGSVNAVPFLDIDTQVNSVANERGLLGLAFAPDYNTTGRFYVNYTNSSGATTISRFTVSSNPDIANTTETILLTISQPFSNHNGGKIAFGQDGYLYISTGDGGSGGDPGNRSQDKTTLLGKLLRIDVSGSTYTIPSDNPYASSANGASDPRPEIWAIGLRNPWKFSFDSLNGELWIADVGQNEIEEINLASPTTADINYGWRCKEGTQTYNTNGNPCTGLTDPIAEYSHSNDGAAKCSITGGYRYRGSLYPTFNGLYFFADLCSAEIGVLTENGSNWTINFQTPNITNSWVSFAEDASGEMYIVGGNRVYKIQDPNLSVTTFENNTLSMFPNPTKKEVTFKFKNDNHSIATIDFYDLQGKKIKTVLPKATINTIINVENFSSGMYLVKINDFDNNTLVKKLIIN